MAELTQVATEGWSPFAAVRVREVAERQGGVVSRAQLALCGLTNASIGRWVGRGWLLRVHPGVYAVGHRAIPPRGRLIAALLYAGSGAVLSHRTAAHHWGLIEEAPPVVHLSAPVRRRNVRGVVVHTPRAIAVAKHDGLPTTGVARTLKDIAPTTEEWELRRALARADYEDLLEAEDLWRVMGRGHPGSARLRRAIENHMPELARTLSPLEDLLLLLCERRGIPLPEPNVRIGPYVVDALWTDSRLIVELDGQAAHSSPDQRRRDAERTAD